MYLCGPDDPDILHEPHNSPVIKKSLVIFTQISASVILKYRTVLSLDALSSRIQLKPNADRLLTIANIYRNRGKSYSNSS